MRQRIFLIICLLIGVLVLSIDGLVVYKLYKNYRLSPHIYTVQPKETTEKEKTTSTPEEILQNISTSTKVGVLAAENFKISFEYPKEWGELIIENDKDNPVIGSAGQWVSSFSGYPFQNLYPPGLKARSAFDYYPDPKTFVDVNPSLGPWWDTPTKEQQIQIFEPLIKVYNERNISGLPLNVEQPHTGWTLISDTPNLSFGWWGNTAMFQHRFAMKYMENSEGDLRGVAYLANEAQDATFSPSYIVALINPDSRIVLTFKFELGTMPEIQQVIKKRQEVKFEGDEAKSLGYKSLSEVCYSYLRDPNNYKNTELGNLLKTINQIILSVKLIEPN